MLVGLLCLWLHFIYLFIYLEAAYPLNPLNQLNPINQLSDQETILKGAIWYLWSFQSFEEAWATHEV